MRVLITILVTIICWCAAFAQNFCVSETAVSPDDFCISSSVIYSSPDEPELVGIAAKLFSEDIKRVTGKSIKNSLSHNVKGKSVIVVGTIGNNPFIDGLIAEGKINVDGIRAGWEQYVVCTISSPAKDVESALVVVGSDRRGAAYGVFALSEAIGVSPLYWWADVPAQKHKALYLSPTDYSSKRPSVKYRGIFINDEGWGFQPWASNTWEPEVGAPGPRTYEKVCELLLRMKANMLAPAMHPATIAFNRIAENKVMADRYGIIMTTSHCEPLHYNNTTEWDVKTQGQWNYLTNKEGINSVLDQRVSEVAPYENVYVLAMRGIHDAGLVGVPEERKVEVTEAALNDQRNMLTSYVAKPIEEIPQVFVPYKEVLDIYERGLNLPEDVTIVWPDDNFGYIKRLSNDAERNRAGGAGVYYHISYLGEPHDYLWLNTTPPTLIYEEMSKAYKAGADRYWLLNVGDIKPGELGIKYFMDLAWNVDNFDFDNSYTYIPEFLSGIFGDKYNDELLDIMSTYYRLGFQRKPEAMGWGVQWNSAFERERMTDTDFSFINYDEAQKRLAEYDRISAVAERILNDLPEGYQDAFYELVYYPVKGASLMNRKMLLAQKSRWYQSQHRAATNQVAQQAVVAYDSINALTRRYNDIKGGKWDKMMQLAPGWVATYLNMPETGNYQPTESSEIQVFVPGQSYDYITGDINILPCLNQYADNCAYFDIYTTGTNQFDWKITTDHPAVNLSAFEGTTVDEERISINIDWDKVAYGKSSAICTLQSSDTEERIIIPLYKPNEEVFTQAKGCYLENNGVVSIPAGLFHRVNESGSVVPQKVMGIGYEDECLLLGEPFTLTQPSRNIDDGAYVEYDFYTLTGGNASIDVYALPVFAINKDTDTQYGIRIDDGIVQWMGAPSKEYSTNWKLNVIKNSALSNLSLNVGQPGKHTLKIYCKDPGMVVQKVVLDFGGKKPSYLGAPTSPEI